MSNVGICNIFYGWYVICDGWGRDTERREVSESAALSLQSTQNSIRTPNKTQDAYFKKKSILSPIYMDNEYIK